MDINQAYTHSELRKGIPVIHPPKENQHTFRFQSSSYNLYKLTAFHSILGDSTIISKKELYLSFNSLKKIFVIPTAK